MANIEFDNPSVIPALRNGPFALAGNGYYFLTAADITALTSEIQAKLSGDGWQPGMNNRNNR